MEIMGGIIALGLINSEVKVNKIPITVYSDSAYVVNCINSKWYVKWRNNGWTKTGGLKNADLWKSLIGLVETFPNITFKHVKGHADNINNNRVDLLCNQEMDNFSE